MNANLRFSRALSTSLVTQVELDSNNNEQGCLGYQMINNVLRFCGYVSLSFSNQSSLDENFCKDRLRRGGHDTDRSRGGVDLLAVCNFCIGASAGEKICAVVEIQ